MSIYNTLYNKRFIQQYFQRRGIAEKGSGSSLLDLGCGILPFQHFYANRFENIVMGDYEIRLPNAGIIAMDAQALPMEANTYNCVLLAEVLEHIPEPRKALSEISRVTKPGGELLLTVPFMHFLHETPHDYTRFTEFNLQKLLQENGFTIEQMYRRGNMWILGIALFEYILFTIADLCKKTKILYPLYWILKQLFSGLFAGFYGIIIWLQLRKKPVQVGQQLTGLQAFNSFVMGYNIVARKHA
jgi:SAM-dependent methyltransferase